MVKVGIAVREVLAHIPLDSLLADTPEPAFQCGWLALKKTREWVIEHPQACFSHL